MKWHVIWCDDLVSFREHVYPLELGNSGWPRNRSNHQEVLNQFERISEKFRMQFFHMFTWKAYNRRNWNLNSRIFRILRLSDDDRSDPTLAGFNWGLKGRVAGAQSTGYLPILYHLICHLFHPRLLHTRWANCSNCWRSQNDSLERRFIWTCVHHAIGLHTTRIKSISINVKNQKWSQYLVNS